MKKVFTLLLIYKDPYILLGYKKRGFGAGRWNGFGGKVKDGESIEDAARRETREEAGIEVSEIERAGVMHFSFEGKPGVLEVHLFCAESFEGEPRESEEMAPRWFHKDEIPFHAMWPDDIHWFPYFLKRKLFYGTFHFDERGGRLIKHEIEEI